MKSLVKKLANTNIGILLRTFLNLKPVNLKLLEKDYPLSVIDAFQWKPIKDYKPKLKNLDILNLFYKVKTLGLNFIFFQKIMN